MRLYYLFSLVFFTVSAAAHEGPHNETNAHAATNGVDPVAVAAILAGLLLTAILTFYAVRDYRNRTGNS